MELCSGGATGCVSAISLAGLGPGGNRMLQITIRGPFIPVELQSFGIE